MDFLGEITKELISRDGRLLNSLEAPSPYHTHLLQMEKGTRTTDDEDQVVTLIVIRKAEEIPELPYNTVVVGDAYDFKPSGIMFDKPVRLTLGYDVNQLPENVTSVALAYHTAGSGWITLKTESGVVAELGEITAPIEHFTTFAVLASLPPPPAFKLSHLSITPSYSKIGELLTLAVRIGKEATITVELTNHGGQEGIYTASLRINGTTQEIKEISLGAEQTEKIIFTVTGNVLGSYLVEIGDLSGEFESLIWINWWLILGFVAAFIVILLLVWWLVRKYVLSIFS